MLTAGLDLVTSAHQKFCGFSYRVEAEAIDAALDETLGDTDSDQPTGEPGQTCSSSTWGDIITDFQFGKPKTNKDGDVD